MSINTWYNVNITIDEVTGNGASSCGGSTTTSVVVSGDAYGPYGNFGTSSGSAPTFHVLQPLNQNIGANTFTGYANSYLDDFNLTGYPSQQPGVIFCSNPDAEDFAYNYVRGPVTYDETLEEGFDVHDFDEGFHFEGDENFAEWGALAKQFSPGTPAAHVWFRIEAHQDNDDSVFRASMNFDVGGDLDPDANGDIALGDGLESGNFAEHVEVELTESGDRWQGKFWYAEPTINGGVRTQLGPAFFVNGDPNEAINFLFWFDSRADAFFDNGTFGSSGGSIQQGPFVALTSPDFTTGTGEDLIIAYRSIENTVSGGGEAVATALTDVEIFDVWLIGYGTSGTLTDAETNLDDPEADHNSTCIYDDVGQASVVGDPGLDPIFDEDFEGGDGDGDGQTFFNGVTEAALMGFLGIVLVASFAASMNERTGAGAVGIIVFTLLGLFVAYFLNYIELWVLVSFTIMGLAVCFLGIKAMASGDGM